MTQTFDENAVMPDAAAMERVRQAIAAYNAERPKRELAMQQRMVLVMGGYAVLAGIVLIWLFSFGIGEVFGIACAVVFFIGWALYDQCVKPVRAFQQDLRDRLLPVIFGFVDEVRYSKGTDPRFMERFPKDALLKYGRAEHDDAVSGSYEGLRFMLSETELATGSGKNKSVLFKGVIFHFIRDAAFPGLLAATKQPNGLQKFAQSLFGTGTLDIIVSGDRRVDDTHEFRTNRPTERPSR